MCWIYFNKIGFCVSAVSLMWESIVTFDCFLFSIWNSRNRCKLRTASSLETHATKKNNSIRSEFERRAPHQEKHRSAYKTQRDKILSARPPHWTKFCLPCVCMFGPIKIAFLKNFDKILSLFRQEFHLMLSTFEIKWVANQDQKSSNNRTRQWLPGSHHFVTTFNNLTFFNGLWS